MSDVLVSRPALPSVTLVQHEQRLVLANGYLHIEMNLAEACIDVLQADFHGLGQYGRNLAAPAPSNHEAGLVLLDLQPSLSSASFQHQALSFLSLQDSADIQAIRLEGTYSSGDAQISAHWTLTLKRGERFFSLDTLVTPHTATTLHSATLSGYFMPTSTYGLFERGVVQRLHSPEPYFASDDPLHLAYFLSQEGCVDVEMEGQSQLVLLNTPVQPGTFTSGFQQVLAGHYPVIDQWSANSWQDAQSIELATGQQWSSHLRIGLNNYAFPVLPLPNEPDMSFADLRTFYTAIYATAVGCLVSYLTPGQIAPTLAFPERSYGSLYTFFDPDAWASVCSLLYSGDAYLQHEARKLIETSAAAMLPSGQIPHHFDGPEPIYVAISGATQTGPNIFWIAAALQYAKVTGDHAWLSRLLPQIEEAMRFLTERFHPAVQLIDAPGPLWIDVFIRNGYTADTNAFMVKLLRDVAEMELFMGNETLALQHQRMASAISEALNRSLWQDDHYVTQMNADGSLRDLVDYDANLLAIAFGIASPEQARRILARIDASPCTKVRPTYVSELFYGPDDTYNGNIGDSAITMGRIAWADALTRLEVGDLPYYTERIIEPLRSDLFESPWLYERYDCEGRPEHNPYYHEYPEILVMLLREISFGITFSLEEITIRPFGLQSFRYHIGNVKIVYTPQEISLSLPAFGSRRFQLFSLLADTSYSIKAGAESWTEKSDAEGRLYFSADTTETIQITAL